MIARGGIVGRTAAYELLSKKSDHRVTIPEANDRLGGRNHTERNGDTVVEETKERGTIVQTCTFQPEKNEPYLNTGPGRVLAVGAT
ncbi:MAG: FAD-dependent oxidoreductase [Candidatus Binatia bacterium]|nr:FAD-dependent oxidoreductase [Candidatus Binatia bacterium]